MDLSTIVVGFWLGLSALAFLWFGGQAVWFYWHLDETHPPLRGRAKLAYYFGGVTLWALLLSALAAIVWGMSAIIVAITRSAS